MKSQDQLIKEYLTDKKSVVRVITDWERLGLTRRQFCERLYDDHRLRASSSTMHTPKSDRVVVVDVSSQSYEVHENQYRSGFMDPEEGRSWRRWDASGLLTLSAIKGAIAVVERDLGADVMSGSIIGFDSSFYDGGKMRLMIAWPDPDFDRQRHITLMLQSINRLYKRVMDGKTGVEAKKAAARLNEIEDAKRKLAEEEKKIRNKLLKGRIQSGQEGSGEGVREGEEVVEADAGKG